MNINGNGEMLDLDGYVSGFVNIPTLPVDFNTAVNIPTLPLDFYTAVNIPTLPVDFNTAVNMIINTTGESALRVITAVTSTNNTNELNTDVNIPTNTS